MARKKKGKIVLVDDGTDVTEEMRKLADQSIMDVIEQRKAVAKILIEAQQIPPEDKPVIRSHVEQAIKACKPDTSPPEGKRD